MDYETQRNKKEKPSIIPIEEVYTDLDIQSNDPYDPSWGYRFDTPRTWAQDSSKNKSIGIRDLKLTPSSGDFTCRFLSFAHIGYYTYTATWNATEGEYEFSNETFHDLKSQACKFRLMSNIINYSLTPSNNFEEIMTDMLNKLNDSSWKGLRADRNLWSDKQQQKNRFPFYVKAPTTENADYTPLQYIMNINWLKSPITFQYSYDANTGVFDINHAYYVRGVLMENASRSSGEDIGIMPLPTSCIDTTTFPYSYETLDSQETPLKDKDGQDILEVECYDLEPVIKSCELLMVIDEKDLASLKSVYSYFNQPLVIKNLAKIKIESKIYYVPFLNFDDGYNLLTPSLKTYRSSFALRKGNKTVKPKENDGMRSNLSLVNVWDRIHLIYHTTFAQTRNRIIGRNNDHWDTPNKRFIVPLGDQDQFYLRFTTDGKHNILPVGCHFNVDLCFMLNSTNNTATGVSVRSS